jgi:hypothetical protein
VSEKSSYEPGTPSWVDLGTKDVEAAASFYGTLFGWTHESAGDDAGGYGFFLKDGKQVAGVGPLMDPQQPPAWASYVTVEDIDATAEKVTSLGGQVVAEPMDLPSDAGRMAVFADTTGAMICGFQPGEHHGAEIVNEPGALAWNEHVSRDPQKAQDFYSELFGWSFERQGTDDKSGDDDDQGPPYWTFSSQGSGGTPLGGMMEMADPFPDDMPSFWGVYFAVADADETVETAKAEGAQVRMEPFDTPPGRIAVLADPGGVHFSVIALNPDYAP